MTPFLLTVFVLLLTAPRVWAADAPVVTVPPPGPTLAQMLAKAAPPPGLVLTVDAEKVTPPAGAALAGKAASPAEIAAAYGLLARQFGGVTALAPATMTLVNENPANPNIYQDMSKEELLTLLSASLSDAQWRAMTGPDGVALADLTDGSQPQIVAALFPDPHFRVYPNKPFQEQMDEYAAAQQSGKPYTPSGLLDVTADLPLARLRLGQTTTYMLPDPGNDYSGGPDDTLGSHYTVFPDSAAYDFGATNPHPQNTLYGISLTAQAPNALKPSDLDFAEPTWQAAVSLTGVKTVGELVARIGTATHRELYVDRHLAGHSLTFTGTDHADPASDLLQALALCLTATYRRVGTAFVLTEFLTGAGATHQQWDDLSSQVAAKKEDLLANLRQTMSSRHSPHDLQGLGNADDLTDAQRDQALKPGGVMEGDAEYPPGTLFLPLDKLTPGQQATVRREAARREDAKKAVNGDGSGAVNLTGKMMLTLVPTWQISLPSLDGPVTLGDTTFLSRLFDLNPKRPAETPDAPAAPKSAKPAPKPPDFFSVMARVPRRAVIARPETVAEVDSLVASLRKTGINQLWLSVFSEGRDRSDLLTEALRASRGTGISVYAVLDLLAWDAKAPPAARDRNIFGEDSAQADAHMMLTEPGYTPSAEGEEGHMPPPDQIIAAPTALGTRKTLFALVRSLAARPGLAGLVWRADEPPGYDPLANINDDDTDRRLGYTGAMRLAFLRQKQVDPLDVAPNHAEEAIDKFLWPAVQVDTPDFALTDQWAVFCADSSEAFLRGLYAAAKSVAPALPILVRQHHLSDAWQVGWYGSWDDPRRLPPTYHSSQDQTQALDGPPVQPAAQDVQAKAQSKIAQTVLLWQSDWPAADLTQTIQDELKGKHWDGFVLDFTQDYPWPAAHGDPLAKLARRLSAPAR